MQPLAKDLHACMHTYTCCIATNAWLVFLLNSLGLSKLDLFFNLWVTNFLFMMILVARNVRESV